MSEKYAELGSVSSGTMRTEDLLNAFLDFLGYQDSDKYDEIRTREDNVTTMAWLDHDCETDEPKFASDLVDELFDILNEYAPPYCYFGAHEGDGADYGFWVSEDALRCGVEDGEIAIQDDSRSVPEFYLDISDHGNIELYRLEPTKSVWGVV